MKRANPIIDAGPRASGKSSIMGLRAVFKVPITLRVMTCLWLVLLTVLPGCQRNESFFRANLVEVALLQSDEEPITPEQQEAIANMLLALFGTPDSPDVFEEEPVDGETIRPLDMFGFDLEKLKRAAGPVYTDAQGRQHGLFRLHCADCHGITGDGKGSRAPTLNPYPRDYRQGAFKYKSTFGDAKPTHEDLKRIPITGIPGTAMPSFDMLPDDDIEALIEYVKYLSLRGETEIRLIEYVAEEAELPPGGIAEIAGAFPLVRDEDGIPTEEPDYDNFVASIRYEWEAAPTLVIRPVTPDIQPDDPDQLAASVQRGRELFYAEETKCAGCHGESALGDGETTDYDAWFEWRKQLDQAQAPQEKIDRKVAEMMALGSLRPRNIRPRNLRLTTLRGGDQPVDIYRRVFSGINGTPMPAQGSLAGIAGDKVPEDEAGGGISRQQVWDLVNYVLSLQQERSGEQLSPSDGLDMASFDMTERSGKSFDFRQLDGEVWIASLFFSTCPHQCRRLNEMIASLQRDEIMQELKYVSVSVDPVVDTPEVLAEYAELFKADPERWFFLNAKQTEVDRFGKYLGISAGYKMHARSLVLFDHTGELRGRYAFNDPDEITSLRKLVPVLLAGKEKMTTSP